MRQIRTAIGTATIDPALLTSAEKLQYEGYLRREEINAAVFSLVGQGPRSRRSHAVRDIAGVLSAKSSAASAQTFSAHGATRWNLTFHCSTRSGQRAAGMALRYGAPNSKAFAAA